MKCYLFREEHIPEKAAFPVIDAHNHLWGNWDVAAILGVMDAVGVVSYADLSANAKIAWAGGGYVLQQASFEGFLTECAARHPGRFYGCTMSTFARPAAEPLFEDAGQFVAETVEVLRDHVARGARGLKILKELGLHFRDAKGDLIPVDDPRLAPIWDEAGALGVPVFMHQSDPYGFFEPVVPENEHYGSLKKYPTWSFSDAKFPRKAELLARRDSVIARHPNTTFVLPHVANFPEDLTSVSRLIEENANVMIDLSARIDELGRQPYSARDFIIRHQDRILFGTDMPASLEMYRCYFRFLETRDEYFFTPDYDGTFERRRWAVCGLGLPPEVLRKLYYENAVRVVPGLKEELKDVVPA